MILFTYKTPVYHYTMTPRESIVYIQLACVLTSGQRFMYQTRLHIVS